jgi:restriction system protein
MSTPLDKTRRAELLYAVFGVLKDHPDGIAAKDALAQVEQRIGLTDYEKDNYPGTDTRRFEKTVRFQTIPGVKAGWMVKKKGVWSITDDGLAAYEQYQAAEPFHDKAVALYRAWDKARKSAEAADVAMGNGSGPLGASITLETAEETAFDEIWSYLGTMSPYDFQDLVAGLLQGMGYHINWVAPPGKDRGVDVIAFRDPLGAEGPRIKVQVKREHSKTDAKGLRAFMSSLGSADIGVFVTLGGYTSDAEEEARTSENRRVTLIDRSDLLDLWIEHYDRIPEDQRKLLPLKTVHYLAREDEAEE